MLEREGVRCVLAVCFVDAPEHRNPLPNVVQLFHTQLLVHLVAELVGRRFHAPPKLFLSPRLALQLAELPVDGLLHFSELPHLSSHPLWCRHARV